MKSVDLFTNCFERDYRDVLSTGFMRSKAEQFRFPFRRVCVTVNNVDDEATARGLAAAAVARGDVDRVIFVADELSTALRVCGLSGRELGRVRHFIDFHLVTLTCTNSDHVLHCGAEVDLCIPGDWVTEAVAKLESNPKYLIANPSWVHGHIRPADEAIGWDEPYHVSDSFSDQLFLAKRSVLAAPVYDCPETGRWYPMQDFGAIFEKRVHQFMVHEGYLRLTDSRFSYEHKGPDGVYYPKFSLWERAMRKVGRMWKVRGRY